MPTSYKSLSAVNQRNEATLAEVKARNAGAAIGKSGTVLLPKQASPHCMEHILTERDYEQMAARMAGVINAGSLADYSMVPATLVRQNAGPVTDASAALPWAVPEDIPVNTTGDEQMYKFDGSPVRTWYFNLTPDFTTASRRNAQVILSDDAVCRALFGTPARMTEARTVCRQYLGVWIYGGAKDLPVRFVKNGLTLAVSPHSLLG